MTAAVAESVGLACGESFKGAMRALPTGVAVISTRSATGVPVGLTVNSLASLSLAPPLVSWALRKNSPLVDVFRGSRKFVVNVLAAGQAGLASRFSAPIANRFEGVSASTTLLDLPRLDSCAAWLVCDMHSDLDIGDHVLMVGAVCLAETTGHQPLGWWAGKYFTPDTALPPVEWRALG